MVDGTTETPTCECAVNGKAYCASGSNSLMEKAITAYKAAALQSFDCNIGVYSDPDVVLASKTLILQWYSCIEDKELLDIYLDAMDKVKYYAINQDETTQECYELINILSPEFWGRKEPAHA